MTARRASTLAVASVVGTALLVVVLAIWASAIGPGTVLRGHGPSPDGTPTATDSTASSSPDAETPADEKHRATPSWLGVVAFLASAAAAVAVVVLLPLLLRKGVRRWRTRRFRRRRRDAADDVEFEVIEPPARVAREILADADEQRRSLLEGAPRNAVVACWHRFETQAAAAGLERHVWETSSEYTMRVLDLVDAYEPAVSGLAALYREARFSDHDLTEAERQAALDALDTIHRTIGVHA